MKIAIITPDYPPQSIGGCATSAQLLTQTLRQHYPVDVFVFHAVASPQEQPGGTAYFFAGKPKALFLNTFFMCTQLWSRLKEYDVIHIYNVSPVLAVHILRLCGRLNNRARIIMTLNNHNGAVASRIPYFQKFRHTTPQREQFADALYNPEVPYGIFGASLRYLQVQCIRWAARKADKYIALTHRLQEEYVAQEYDSSRFVVIPNMADSEARNSEPHPQQNEKIHILFVGQLSPLKGQQEFLRAFAALPHEIQEKCQVTILGKGKSQELLTNLIEQHHLSQVRILYASAKELTSWYNQADLLVHLSTNPEPFSRVWLEAMQYGVPLLSADSDGAQEVCADAAVYCNPFSVESIQTQLQLLIEDDTLRQRLSQKAKERLQHYLPSVVQPHFLELYKKEEEMISS